MNAAEDRFSEELTASILREKQSSNWPEGFPEDDGLALRVHRAISWIDRAEQETEDLDATFVFYWIAFNAAYAQDIPETHDATERRNFGRYFNSIVDLDTEGRIFSAVWDRFSDSIRVLLDNKFVFQQFWNYHNGIPDNDHWESRFQGSKNAIARALGRSDTEAVLSILFDRLYVLRNQIIHGGATWNSSMNRDQVRDGARIMSFLVPVFVDVMN